MCNAGGGRSCPSGATCAVALAIGDAHESQPTFSENQTISLFSLAFSFLQILKGKKGEKPSPSLPTQKHIPQSHSTHQDAPKPQLRPTSFRLLDFVKLFGAELT